MREFEQVYWPYTYEDDDGMLTPDAGRHPDLGAGALVVAWPRRAPRAQARPRGVPQRRARQGGRWHLTPVQVERIKELANWSFATAPDENARNTVTAAVQPQPGSISGS